MICNEIWRSTCYIKPDHHGALAETSPQVVGVSSEQAAYIFVPLTKRHLYWLSMDSVT